MIDVKTPNTPGWWMLKACRKREGRLPRLQKLADYFDGNPPLPTNNKAVTDAFKRVQKDSCTNMAELIVGSLRERITVRDVRTASSGDQIDDDAWRIWVENGLDVEFADVLENMLAMGDGYMIVGQDPDTDEIAVTGEDPRQVVTIHNPVRQSEIRAAVKVFHDPDEQKDYVYLYLPGERDLEGVLGNARRYVAVRARKNKRAGIVFSAGSFEWDEDRGGAEGEELQHPRVPVIRFRNRRGVGEFEPHLSILDRINNDVYTRVVIALYQAYKQRAIQVDDTDEAVDGKGDPLENLDDVLTSDPGSWIQLPFNSKVWESSQADLQGILSATKDDIRLLAAVTRRPMDIFSPDNQSAAGAGFSREGLTFAVEDKQVRAGQGLVELFHLIFLTLGDADRADRSGIIIGWKPGERYSITDKGSSAAQSVGVLPKRTIMREIYQMTPPQIDQAEAEAADELLLMQEIPGADQA
ncbi:phage portal protein [Frigoribacterium sp. VKM Ac-2530]|uniref:phage portal protein n=1 Tax=Frigoribacterium sp. VKM Ac-2530 TaxID=2783822 RepID=UPI00188C9A56|nr:phage portal protein [Frigoribacterium sp. VKM Ac-2530]MBF4578949.1 phage portal protein [Frigoribacterium sp. VKM Ac-2530]